MNYRTHKERDSGQALIQMLRIRLTIALIATLSLLSGCGNKSNSQISNPNAESDKSTRTVSSDYEQILNGVRNIVAKQLSLDASAIDVDVSLSKQKVAADELDVVEIIMNIEETFNIEIKDEEVSNPVGQLKDDVSVRKLADIVARKKKGK
jgi:acyl carrier protein